MKYRDASIPAIDFWRIITYPTIQEFYDSPNDFRKLALSIWAMDALIEHICWENYFDLMSLNERKFLADLVKNNTSYRVLHEASNALKHAVRSGKHALTSGSNSVTIRSRGWGEAEFGVDEWGSTPLALVSLLNGNSASIKFAIQKLEAWVISQLA